MSSSRIISRVAPLGVAIVTLAAVFGLMASGQETTTILKAFDNGALRVTPNTAFGFGEKLNFSINYKFVTAGNATMAISNKAVTVAGRPTYEVKFDVRTTPSFDKVFQVSDRYRSYIDVDGIFPWRFEQSVREGKYSRDFSANIDQRSHQARTTEGSFRISPFVHDILSAFYFTRAADVGRMAKGQSFTLKNFYGKKAHDLRIRVLGTERVKVDAGTFDCILVEPMVQEGGLFKSEGRILVWLTNDAIKMPVKVSAKVPIGAIEGRLTSYSGTRGTVTAKR